MAVFAGVCCPDTIANAANRPDEDFRRSGIHGLARVIWTWILLGYDEAWVLAHEQAQWHFPLSANGEVEPGNPAARANMEIGLEACDIEKFGEGLHTLQDSWSHQGRPYWWGLIGHARGGYYDDDAEWWDGSVLYPGRGWVPVSDEWAAASRSADNAGIWPADVRAAAMATFNAIVVFKNRCSCACPRTASAGWTKATCCLTGRQKQVYYRGKTVYDGPTSCREEDRDGARGWLEKHYGGPNKLP
jgi:hypothetical protein